MTNVFSLSREINSDDIWVIKFSGIDSRFIGSASSLAEYRERMNCDLIGNVQMRFIGKDGRKCEVFE